MKREILKKTAASALAFILLTNELRVAMGAFTPALGMNVAAVHSPAMHRAPILRQPVSGADRAPIAEPPALGTFLKPALAMGREAAPSGFRASIVVIALYRKAFSVIVAAGRTAGTALREAARKGETPATAPAERAPVTRLPAPWDHSEPAPREDRMKLVAPEPLQAEVPLEAEPRAAEPKATPVEPAVEPREEKPAQELRVERSHLRPRLRALQNFINIVERGEGPNGFRTMKLLQQTAHSSAQLVNRPRVASNPVTRQRSMEMRDVDTNARPAMETLCGRGAQCSVNSKGQRVLQMGPMKMTHVSYDQRQEYGQRNTWEIEDANGSRHELKSSPLVFDLDKNGVRSSDKTARFDIDGDGRLERVYDVSSGDGLLVFDGDRDGVSGESGLELLGDNSDLDGDGRRDGFKDGFEAFNALVRKAVREGALPAGALNDRRLDARELAKIERAYGLKMRVGGLNARAVLLSEAGVTQVALSGREAKRTKNFDGQGNDVTRQDGATFLRADGSQGSYEDVWFSAQPDQAFGGVPPRQATFHRIPARR